MPENKITQAELDIDAIWGAIDLIEDASARDLALQQLYGVWLKLVDMGEDVVRLQAREAESDKQKRLMANKIQELYTALKLNANQPRSDMIRNLQYSYDLDYAAANLVFNILTGAEPISGYAKQDMTEFIKWLGQMAEEAAS